MKLNRFKDFASKQNSLLFMAFQLQLSLIDHVGGKKFWQRQTEKRYSGRMDLNKIVALVSEVRNGARGRHQIHRHTDTAGTMAETKPHALPHSSGNDVGHGGLLFHRGASRGAVAAAGGVDDGDSVHSDLTDGMYTVFVSVFLCMYVDTYVCV